MKKPQGSRYRDAAITRWDPARRRQAVFQKIIKLIQGYEYDHGEFRLSKEEAYIILDSIGWRTANPTGFARKELCINMDQEILP